MGTVRVSTAYEFFQAVKEHLVFEPKAYMNRAKPTFEATDYMLLYYAADANDAVGKACNFTLNRSEMWNPSVLKGSSTKYEFIGLASSKIAMRSLPCPCQQCFAGTYAMCTNIDIVSTFLEKTMTITVIEAPEYLELPLAPNRDYSKPLLRAFLQLHDVRLGGVMSRLAMIDLIHLQLSDYLIAAPLMNT